MLAPPLLILLRPRPAALDHNARPLAWRKVRRRPFRSDFWRYDSGSSQDLGNSRRGHGHDRRRREAGRNRLPEFLRKRGEHGGLPAGLALGHDYCAVGAGFSWRLRAPSVRRVRTCGRVELREKRQSTLRAQRRSSCQRPGLAFASPTVQVRKAARRPSFPSSPALLTPTSLHPDPVLLLSKAISDLSFRVRALTEAKQVIEAARSPHTATFAACSQLAPVLRPTSPSPSLPSRLPSPPWSPSMLFVGGIPARRSLGPLLPWDFGSWVVAIG